jgi:hypothetical protein
MEFDDTKLNTIYEKILNRKLTADQIKLIEENTVYYPKNKTIDNIPVPNYYSEDNIPSFNPDFYYKKTIEYIPSVPRNMNTYLGPKKIHDVPNQSKSDINPYRTSCSQYHELIK